MPIIFIGLLQSSNGFMLSHIVEDSANCVKQDEIKTSTIYLKF